MKEEINVSEGKMLEFKAGEETVSGLIIKSTPGDGVSAQVTVEITEPINEGVELSVPDCGGCGTAHIIRKFERMFVTLDMSIECLDHRTIGK